jgi:hypothetical protein
MTILSHISNENCIWQTLRVILSNYSPELNPDEGINGDLKQGVTGKPPARSRPELKRNLINHMRKLSKSPRRVRSLFQHPTFRYAA